MLRLARLAALAFVALSGVAPARAAELVLFEQLAEQVGESWQSDRNSVELLEELREESACR